MYRPATRFLLRASQNSLAPARTFAGRRFLSSEPPHLRSRSWKSSALRWGVAVAGIYYYNTSSVFAEQPANYLLHPLGHSLDDDQTSSSNPVDSLITKRRAQDQKNASTLASVADVSPIASSSDLQSSDAAVTSDPSSLEEEAEAQGAFNEETGEINWDCPCLGGMAHGPCGPDFREAFSCFVFSKEDPKGMDCIEKFKGMQECFQRYPEVYKGELEEDEELEAEVEKERQEMAQQIAAREASERPDHLLEATPKRTADNAAQLTSTPPQSQSKKPSSTEAPPQGPARLLSRSEPNSSVSEHETISEGQSSASIRQPGPSPVKDKFDVDLELMPKEWHDARSDPGLGKETGK